MSETAEVKVKEPLFSKKNKKLLSDPLNDDNPITIQVLGICSALAITVQVKQAFVMSVSVLAVMIFANLIVSLMRNLIPSRVRIIVQLDAIGNAAGYAWILIVVAVFREFFGSGKLWGVQLIPQAVYDFGYFNNGLMILPPMALITVGIIIWVQRSRNTKLIESN